MPVLSLSVNTPVSRLVTTSQDRTTCFPPTDHQAVGSTVGIRLNPEDIHIMHKSEYSGMFGDYSSYSAEYDELTEDADDEEE